MKQSICLLMVTTMLLFNSTTNAAFVGDLPYETYVAIGTGSQPEGGIIDLSNEPGTQISSNSYYYLDHSYSLSAKADEWNLGVSANLSLVLEDESGGAAVWSKASFRQKYIITHSGEANIDFHLEGSLSGHYDADYFGGSGADGEAYVQVSVDVLDGNWKGTSYTPINLEFNHHEGSYDSEQAKIIEMYPDIELYFDDNDIGKTFWIQAEISSVLSAEGEAWGTIIDDEYMMYEPGYVALGLDADFINTFEITGVSGGIVMLMRRIFLQNLFT